MKLYCSISFFVLCFGCHIAFEIWIAILKGRDFLEVIAVNGNDNIEMYFEEVVLECVDCISLAVSGDQ